jgi:hypothetical protein
MLDTAIRLSPGLALGTAATVLMFALAGWFVLWVVPRRLDESARRVVRRRSSRH